jgi:hypothetical protein
LQVKPCIKKTIDLPVKSIYILKSHPSRAEREACACAYLLFFCMISELKIIDWRVVAF